MGDADNEKIHVTVAMDFSDDIIEQLRDISPRLHVERHFPEVPANVWPKTEVLYTTRHFPEPDEAPLLRWIQLHGAGVDRALKVPIIQVEDIEVTSASGIHVTQMAEYCLAMMLALAYKLPRMLAHQAKAEWGTADEFAPNELRGSTLGIVGYGSVGRELARLADALGITVLATKRDLKHPAERQAYRAADTGDADGTIPERLYPPQAVASMARDSDCLVITVPLTKATYHLIGEAVFDAMKPGAVLINVARGSVVDEKALITALSREQIAGAALDVFEEEPLPPTSPLWNLDNVILSPHVSGNSIRYHMKAAALFSENLRRYLDNQPLLNVLDREREY